MRAYRTPLIAVVAVVVGFILAQSVQGCRDDGLVMIPQTVKVGDVLKWQGVDPKAGTLILTIPDRLCEKTAALGKSDPKYHVYVVKVGPDGLECKVKSQSGNATVPWVYKYRYVSPQGKDADPAAAGQSNVQVLDVVGSCDGCSAAFGGDVHVNTRATDVWVDMVDDGTGNLTPTVDDYGGNQVQNINVPPTPASVYWHMNGPGALSIKFTSTSPCPDISGLGTGVVTCNIPSTANPGPYHYHVSVDGNESQYDYTVTVPPSKAPPH